MRTEKRAVVHHQTQTQRFSIEPISWYEEVSFQVQTHESLSRYTILCPGRIPSGFRMHEKVLGGISMVETVSSSLGRPGIRGRFLMNTKFDCVRKAREARVVYEREMLKIPDLDNTSDVAGDEERYVGGKLEFGSSGSHF
ncbi:hypothetical protein HO173_008683 [Letharia columbiana]|uniref:Uncharacterized protein n=1 Tax=Letharia columbiana TaxID=112416 RepID=A0A8H6L2K3_9LECA|nr:uncharacterized protein HO173_008683 [Letharia columbiana]KAF6233139.1 hypothetical protein HO173_008683 [Letharia columbiana]